MAESAASAERPGGLALGAYRLGTRALTPFLPAYLRRRRARGREMPERWREKLGFASLPRPEGPLVWLHAVGLGEVLALRGLIAALSQARGDLEFLVTSSARSSAEVIARNLPPRTRHQFLPLDTPRFAVRFLDHWRPDLSIWAEQDFWPGLVAETHARGIPLALVNARMDAASLAARRRGRALFAPLYACFTYLGAQDEASAENLAALGAPGVSRHASLKLFAPPLATDPKARAALKSALGARPHWLCASSHPADEEIAIAAHRQLLKARPDTVLTLVPRDPERRAEIAAKLHAAGLHATRRGAGALPDAETQVYLGDTLGELGLFYDLAPAALIGGTFSDVEGHNPWEAVRAGCAVLHGPRCANFAADFTALDSAGGALGIETAEELAAALQSDLGPQRQKASAALAARQGELDALTGRLLALLPDGGAR